MMTARVASSLIHSFGLLHAYPHTDMSSWGERGRLGGVEDAPRSVGQFKLSRSVPISELQFLESRDGTMEIPDGEEHLWTFSK